jgi:hypothetical protein
MATKSKQKVKKAKVKSKSGLPAVQPQKEFPSPQGAKAGTCRVCGADCGPKSSLCSTHRAHLSRKRDRALFLFIKKRPEGVSLIQKAIKAGACKHLGIETLDDYNVESAA